MSFITDTLAVTPPIRDPRTAPYGPLGLVIGGIVIIGLALVITAAVGLAAFGVAVGLLGLAEVKALLGTLQSRAGSDEALLRQVGIVASVVLYLATSGMVILAARFRAGSDWRNVIGWHPWRQFRGARYWLLVGATLVYAIVADVVIGRFYPPSKDWVTPPTGSIWVGLFVILAVLLAPLTEELFFRGWLYTGLRTRLSAPLTIAVTATLFALAHWEKTHLYALVVLPIGVSLGIMRERAGTLFAAMTFHALYNGLASLMLVFGPAP